jgi:hypothetical protein
VVLPRSTCPAVPRITPRPHSSVPCAPSFHRASGMV